MLVVLGMASDAVIPRIGVVPVVSLGRKYLSLVRVEDGIFPVAFGPMGAVGTFFGQRGEGFLEDLFKRKAFSLNLKA